MKKLTCHCGGVEAEVKIPENGFEKLMRCNCSICKRKGYVIGVIGPDDFKLIKGENLLTLYQFIQKQPNIIFVKFVELILTTDQELIQKYMELM